MITSPGLVRSPSLVPLACRWCCSPAVLCCLLMLACALLAPPALAERRPNNGKYTSNFTEITEDGSRYQIIKNEPVQVSSQLYQQVEYVLPAPGPRLLILVNFTRIDTDSHNSSLNDSNDSSSGNSNGANSSSSGHVGSVDQELSGVQLPRVPGESGRDGPRHQASSAGPGRDMLAVDDTRRHRLHHSEGGQLKHPGNLESLSSHSPDPVAVHDNSQPAVQAKGKSSKALPSTNSVYKVRKQLQEEYAKLNETNVDGLPVNFSNIAALFPSLVKANTSHHTPTFSTINKANESSEFSELSHSSLSENGENYLQETLVNNVAADSDVGQVTPTTLPSEKSSVISHHTRSGSLPGDGSGRVTSDKHGLSVTRASDSHNKINQPPHAKRLLNQANPTLVSLTPFANKKDLPLISKTESFSARDLLDQLSPNVRTSGPSEDEDSDRYLTTRVPDHTEYFQLASPGVDSSTSQDCSLKVIIEEADWSETHPEGEKGVQGGPGLVESRREEKRRAQPQVICWQASFEQGQLPRVYRYTTPLKITYLWTDKKPGRLLLKFRLLSLDEVECHFQCSATPYLCLVRQQLCDGYSDCPDQSDELSSVCASTLDQGDTGEGSKLPNVIASVVIPCGFVFIIFIVFLMIKHKLLGHSARRSGDSLLSPPPSHSSEACRSSQDSDQNDALLPDRPPPYCRHQQEQQHQQQQQQQQQHQHLLTYTSTGVVSSLEPVQVPAAQHRQLLLPQQQQQQQQQNQHHYPQYQQLQHPNNNISGHSINNNDLSGAVSFHQQQAYQLSQQQQHMLLQQPLQAHSSNNQRDRVDAQQPTSSSPVFSGNGSHIASPHEIVGGFQHDLYNNPLSSRDDSNNQGNTSERYYSQHTHSQHHQQNQSQQQVKQPRPLTGVQATPGFQTMSVLPPPQQQYPPHIPVSLDGEEGYSAAQRSLHSKRQMEQNLEAEYGIFRAPPNRSALERDSPPPPYSLQPPNTTGFSLDSLLGGSTFSSSCPMSFASSFSSSQSPGYTRGGRGRGGGGGHSQGSSSSQNCASSAPTNRH
ncbi:hypothetical protein EGW08_011861 [Elysia chlorotica]|uniref:Uncharacterized protein n=1 Tax=Elysia chlorotica TaxID=188477 RepID=A0A3S0ZQE7_ELYCH|nr:hypothetical protein EGW08_011861 [Elysia chlorotica]